MTIAADPQIVTKIFAFNLGVELGQVIALVAMLAAIAIWRGTPVQSPATRIANLVLIAAGATLFTQQLFEYLTARA